jgi:hypothetical protein
VLLVGGCQDRASEYINGKFPPVTVEMQQQAAIQSAAATLHELDAPNLAFGAPLSRVQEVLLTRDLSSQGVKAVRLSAERQLVRAEIDFDKVLDADVGTPQGKLIHELKPSVSGTLELFAGITSGTSNIDDGKLIINMKVLPVFRTIRISQVVVKGSYDVTSMGDAVVWVLNTFADNVTGTLSGLSTMQVKVPATFSETANPSQVLTIRSSAFQGEVTVTSQTVSAPVKLRGVAWLVEGNQIGGLAELVPISEQAKSGAGPPVEGTNEAVLAMFKKAFADGFGVQPDTEKVWTAVRKDVVSFVVNTALSQARLCASGKAFFPNRSSRSRSGFQTRHQLTALQHGTVLPRELVMFKRAMTIRTAAASVFCTTRLVVASCEATIRSAKQRKERKMQPTRPIMRRGRQIANA